MSATEHTPMKPGPEYRITDRRLAERLNRDVGDICPGTIHEGMVLLFIHSTVVGHALNRNQVRSFVERFGYEPNEEWRSWYCHSPYHRMVEEVTANLPVTEAVTEHVITEVHRSDIERISRILIAEAQDRGWCSEYDEVIDRINEDLTVPMLRRRQTWRVHFQPAVMATDIEYATPPTRSEVESWLSRAQPGATLVSFEQVVRPF